MRTTIRLLAAAALLCVPTAAHAQAGFSIGARGGTLGLGGEAAISLTRFFGIRGGIGALPFTINSTYSDIEYEIKPPSTIGNVGVDIHPTGGAFRLAAGVMFRKDITLTAQSNATYQVGPQTYSGSEIGTIHGTISNSSTAPYATFGFGSNGRVGVGLDFGAAFMGTTEVTLTTQGGNPTVTNSQTFKSNLAQEEQNAEEDLGGYLKVHPIVNLTINIKLH